MDTVKTGQELTQASTVMPAELDGDRAAHYARHSRAEHIRGIKDTINDHEMEVLELLQLCHDSRIARTRSYEDGSGKRVALHRRRRRGIKVRKAPVKVMLPARMVKLPDRLR